MNCYLQKDLVFLCLVFFDKDIEKCLFFLSILIYILIYSVCIYMSVIFRIFYVKNKIMYSVVFNEFLFHFGFINKRILYPAYRIIVFLFIKRMHFFLVFGINTNSKRIFGFSTKSFIKC